MREIVLASSNPGKLKELQELLAEFDYRVIPQTELAIEDAIEDGLSFVENAILKARHAASLSGRPALADDSGLEVDALNGAPGIYSARFAGEPKSDAANNQKLLDELNGEPAHRRSARYQCLLVLMRSAEDPTPLICQGTWEGTIETEPRGNSGFGYDPLFIVPELGKTAAELDAKTKNRLSHRGQALRLLASRLRDSRV